MIDEIMEMVYYNALTVANPKNTYEFIRVIDLDTLENILKTALNDTAK